MNKVCGNQSDYVPFKQDRSRYIISYGLEEAPNNLYTWYEIYFYKKQKSLISFDDVKNAILDDINSKIKAKILNGFVWNGINVWLSEENQRNFSEAQRMAEKYGEQVLPLRFKLGEDSEGNPVYHTFETVAELDAFYTQAFRYVNQCLNEGWAKKDNFDWKPYEELLPNPDTPTEEPVTE